MESLNSVSASDGFLGFVGDTYEDVDPIGQKADELRAKFFPVNFLIGTPGRLTNRVTDRNEATYIDLKELKKRSEDEFEPLAYFVIDYVISNFEKNEYYAVLSHFKSQGLDLESLVFESCHKLYLLLAPDAEKIPASKKEDILALFRAIFDLGFEFKEFNNGLLDVHNVLTSYRVGREKVYPVLETYPNLEDIQIKVFGRNYNILEYVKVLTRGSGRRENIRVLTDHDIVARAQSQVNKEVFHWFKKALEDNDLKTIKELVESGKIDPLRIYSQFKEYPAFLSGIKFNTRFNWQPQSISLSPEMLQYFINFGLNPNQNLEGHGELWGYGSYFRLFQSLDRLDLIKVLLDNGYVIKNNYCSNMPESWVALGEGNHEMIRYYLIRGLIDFDIVYTHACSPESFGVKPKNVIDYVNYQINLSKEHLESISKMEGYEEVCKTAKDTIRNLIIDKDILLEFQKTL